MRNLNDVNGFWRSMRTSTRAPRAALLAAIIIAGSTVAASTAPQATAAGATTAFKAVTPCRLADTRSGYGETGLGGGTISVQATGRCDIPAGATAVAVAVTIINPSAAGYATIYPDSATRPTTSSANFTTGQTITASSISQLSLTGALDVYTNTPADILVDVTGAFVPATAATDGRFVTVTPTRVLDTRTGVRMAGGTTRTIALPTTIPADAVAVAANITLVNTAGAGYLTAHPGGTAQPDTTTVSADAPGQVRAAATIVGLSGRSIQLTAAVDADVLVDISGYFTGPTAASSTAGLYTPTAPVRVIDTRIPAQAPQLYPAGTRILSPAMLSAYGVPAAAAVSANWTVTSMTSGYLTAYPAMTTRPVVSTLNQSPSGTVSNYGVVPETAAGVAAYAYSGAHLIVDVNGWFTGPAAATTTTTVPTNTPASTYEPLSTIPRTGVGTSCAKGIDAAALNTFFNSGHYFDNTKSYWHGGDYQRSYRLPDNRVLWMFQDALIGPNSSTFKIVHNVGMIQSGNCFTLLHSGTPEAPKSWIMWNLTTDRVQWYWPMGGEISPDGKNLYLNMAQMNETGATYLSATAPTAMYTATISLGTIPKVTTYQLAPNSTPALYGFSVTSDLQYTYLYSHCYKQFGWGILGYASCAEFVKVARVPKGQMLAPPTYWNGSAWVADPAAAVPIISRTVTGADNNPPQVIWDGRNYLLISKEGDWWGTTVDMFKSSSPVGPWTKFASVPQPLRCAWPNCDTYFASWLPWTDNSGTLMWSLSHNTGPGKPIITAIYRPTVHTVTRPS